MKKLILVAMFFATIIGFAQAITITNKIEKSITFKDKNGLEIFSVQPNSTIKLDTEIKTTDIFDCYFDENLFYRDISFSKNYPAILKELIINQWLNNEDPYKFTLLFLGTEFWEQEQGETYFMSPKTNNVEFTRN